MILDDMNKSRIRIIERGHRKPLRTINEMAEEFGVSVHVLASRIKNRNGPPSLKSGTTNRAVWYEPNALRKWWVNINE